MALLVALATVLVLVVEALSVVSLLPVLVVSLPLVSAIAKTWGPFRRALLRLKAPKSGQSARNSIPARGPIEVAPLVRKRSERRTILYYYDPPN